jgi:hypothetical protein
VPCCIPHMRSKIGVRLPACIERACGGAVAQS